MDTLRKTINTITVLAAFCLCLCVLPAEAALPSGLQDVYTIFTTGIGTLVQSSPYDSYGRDGGSYASWSSTDFILSFDGGNVGGSPPPGIIIESASYPPVGAFLTYDNASSGFDTNQHWMKVAANNSTLGSFQLGQLIVEGAGTTGSGGSCSFTVNIIGNKVGGGTVQTGNLNYVIELGSPQTLTLTNVSGVQLSSFEIHFTATNSSPSPANFTFQSFTVSNAKAPSTVTSISPTSGFVAGGTSVVITGTNFTGATVVKFGSTDAASFIVDFPTQITATSPAGSAGTVDITVDGSATSVSDLFTYIAGPTITSATYDASTGVLAVTGTNMTTGDTIAVNKLTLTGEGGSTYSLTSSNVTASSATAFSVTLNGTDKAAVNQILNKNGTSSTGGTTFNLAAADDWDANFTSGDTSDAANPITVNNVAAPAITNATYDAATGALVVTGSGFLKRSGANNDIIANKMTITGEGGITYTLTDSANVEITSGTSFTLTLSATDKAAINQIINKNGTSSTGGTAYNLAAAEDWNAGADPAVVIADLTGNGIIVSNVAIPTITSATYDATTGALVVTGTGFLKLNGTANDIVANKFTLTGESGATYTLTDTANVEITSGTSFTLTLSATDKAAINQIINKNGTSSTGGTAYNLAAAEDWNAGADPAVVIADLTGNGIIVSNVAIPTITSATYDASTGALVVTGTGFSKLNGSTNDIVANKFTFTGEGGATYTLTDTANVEITSGTSFTLALSATDKGAINQILNKNGISSTSGTAYNLAAAEDWNAGADPAVVIADTAGNSITVSNVATPTITSATYDAGTGALVVTGTGFLPMSGASNDIIANKFTVTGEGGSTYTLTDTANVDITSGTAFTLTLSATDKAAINQIINKNGTSSTGATTYNLAAAEDWNAGADSAVVIADLTGNGITVSNVAVPAITSATYDTSTGALVVTGTGFLKLNGPTNDIDVSKLTIAGDSTAYTLTSSSVEITSGTSFTVNLNGADKTALAARLNKNGVSSVGAVTYNLAAADHWAAGAAAGVNVADLTGNAITVSNIVGAQTATASAATLTPVAGANDAITLTVKDSLGNTDANFSGAKNITISGYQQAPDGSSFGSFNGITLTASPNTISVTFTSGVATPNLALNKAAAQTIGFSIAGVATPATNSPVITPAPAAAASMTVSTNITAPASNGGNFAQQPVITLKDAYGNTCTGDSATQVTASKKDAGTWTLIGTAAKTASSGIVTFTNLGATNIALVNNAQLAFDATGLTQVTSATVTLPAPAPAQTATASATTLTPVAGATNAITLTVKDSLGNTDTSFSGAKNVTISGYQQAPDGSSYGSFNGTTLTASPNTISVTFTSGVATPNLALNKAAAQTIGFSIATVATPATNSLAITPLPAAPTATAATSITFSGFKANWNSVTGATGYYLDVATDSGFTSMVTGYNNLDVHNVTTSVVGSLTSNTQYHYRVRAYSDGGTSGSSNTIDQTTATTKVVTTISDSGAGSLRDTIAAANPGDAITFDAAVTGTITLGSTLTITKDLTISGPGAANLTINGGGTTRPFLVNAGVSFTLEKLTVANGSATDGGALIDDATSTTTITGCAFTNNSATANGGAIYAAGTMTISDTLFNTNSAVQGGAIFNNNATLALTNVTINGNSASSNGGGIYNSNGTATIVNATIAGNSATTQGGGIEIAGGTLNLKNSIIANNTSSGGPDIFGTVASQGYNLIRNTTGATIGGDTTGNDTTGNDPLLGALAINGGPTKTMALLSGSPAIDKGNCASGPAADQRGLTRSQDATCDMGAYERGVAATLTATSGSGQSAPLNTAFTNQLKATVVDSLGGMLDGISVTFAGPASGAGIAPGSSVNTNTSGIASYTATANGTAGTYTVTATVDALSANYSLTNNLSSQSITFANPGNQTFGTTPALTATASSGLTPTFTSSTTSVCTITNGGVLTFITTGTCTITVNQAGSATYGTAIQVTQSFTVDKATATIALGNLSATYDGTAKTVTATTTPAGKTVTFTFNGSTTAPTAVGSYAVIATINDTNYQGTASGTLVISYSTTPPTLTISTLADSSVTNSAILNVSGTASAINGIKSVTTNGTAVTVAADGAFSQAVTLQPGKNTVIVIATDNADLTATDSRTITLDTASPVITITAPADNSTLAAASVTITGTVDKSATIQASVNSGSPQSAAMDGNNFTVTLNLTEGTNTVEVSATDLAGNSASVKRTIVSDTTRPTLAITDPAQDITTSQATITITGTVSDALTTVSVTITCDGQTYTPQVTNGSFQQQITFTGAKQYAIAVTATDLAGNSATTQRNVIYAPSAALPTGDINNDGTVDIADALLALQMAVGLATPTPTQLAAGDVAPLVDGKPAPDGVIDVGDAVVILEKVVGIVTW